ncbi:MAG: hypothetical protein WDM79_15465 [Terricaulis sp.]
MPTSPSTAFLLGAFSVGCLVFGFIIPLFPTIAAFVLGVIGAARSKLDGDETGLLLSRIGWIGALVCVGLGVLVPDWSCDLCRHDRRALAL